jgi:UDP-hydrolysing UDP-N-acetyl-D-glucosamine 2-epimerase
MKRKVAVFTGTRAEYGLLYWLLKDVQASERLQLQLIVSAMHLSPEFGQTWRQIEQDGFPIDAKVEMLLSSDSATGVAKSMGLGTIGFADALDRLRPDWLVVLGDRFEALAIVQAALVMRVPVVHLHGGETTEGAFDDAIRHAITKMASLHFVAAQPYRRRVIQMGEAPDTVFDVGALGLDHLARTPLMSPAELARSIGFPLAQPYVLATYHPVTAQDEDPAATAQAMLQALDSLPGHQVLLTFPNADNGGRAIIECMQRHAAQQPQRVALVESLGSRRYLSALAHASAVVGNSSSGIIEAPAFKVPTVNIGVRQQGRLAAASVVDCRAEHADIARALQLAISERFRERCATVVNPYGQGAASARIVQVLEARPAPAHKRFHDLDFA